MNNYDAGIKREKMLSAFTTMIKPARIIANFSQEELAEKSGLSLELVSGVENGMHRFHESHYLALAAVFDNTKYTEDSSIYRAVLRILTPEDEIIRVGNDDDFVLIRRWFETFSGGNESDDGRVADNLVEDIVKNYDIYVDTSAVEDENFPAFVSRLEPLLRAADAEIFVPSTIIDELSDDIETSEDEKEKLNLTEALEYVRVKSNEGLIHIQESYGGFDDFDDTEDFLASTIADASNGDKILVITQEFELSQDLTSGHQNVIAAYINDKGDIIMWR